MHNAVPGRSGPGRRAFTLIELLTVISIILLAAGIALPTMAGLISENADAQAYNILAAQLTAARADAAVEANYMALHVQISGRSDLADRCYMAVCAYDPSAGTFGLFEGRTPELVPGRIAFGEVLTSGSNYPNPMSDSDLQDLTTFSIVFNPRGQVVTQVPYNGSMIGVRFQADDGLFSSGSGDTPSGTELWYPPSEELGRTAITMFDYLKIKNMPGTTRGSTLQETGQYIPINVYTGQLFPRR